MKRRNSNNSNKSKLKINHRNEALSITIRYGIFGVLWILLSDRILSLITSDPSIYTKFQTVKGWLYVLITMILIYFLIQNRIKIIRESSEEIYKAYENIKSINQELREVDKRLQYEKNLNENIIDVSSAIICVWSEDYRIIKMNPYGLKLLGYTSDEITGKDWIELFVPSELRDRVRGVVGERIINRIHAYEGRFITKEGKLIDLLCNTALLNEKSGLLDEYVTICVDITERNKYLERINYMALYDKLTGLPNKAKLEIDINNIISENNKESFAIAYLDFDNFKYVNETLGHQVGDKFLKHVGDIFKEKVKSPNFVARVSGDKFAIVYAENKSTSEVIDEIESLKNCLGRTWKCENYTFFVSMSVGLVSYPKDGQDINTLMQNAEIAMYSAKQQGKNKTLLYKDEIKRKNEWYINMANKIQMGMDNNEFMLYYQPQYELKSNKIIGVEALIRWKHEDEGFISPAVFIPVAEQTGQIYSLELWIFETALKQKKEWERLGFGDLEISINISAKTLISDDNFEKLELLFSSYDIDYSKIYIEITETAIISDVNLTVKRLSRLKELGLKVALDDFGTGYSSLTYLKELPIDSIKLDQSFINLVSHNEKDSIIVKSIIYLAQELKYTVVAEGIETIEQLEFLKKYACEHGQGYLLSHPLPLEEINKLLIKG